MVAANAIFISYRRDDEAVAALALHRELSEMYGEQAVFMDTAAIRTSDQWKTKIEGALEQMQALVAVIGPKWLKLQDVWGRRRLDVAGDWVTNELATAIRFDRVICPFLVNGADLPPPDALPNSIRAVCDQQSFRARNEQFDSDCRAFARSIGTRLRLRPVAGLARLPKPLDTIPRPLNENEIAEARRRISPEWKLESRADASAADGRRVEIVRAFDFGRGNAGFADAIEFMRSVVDDLNRVNHHPRWENQWVTVRVWLTTWSVGFHLTRRDFVVAEILDRRFAERGNGAASHARTSADAPRGVQGSGATDPAT
jgi:pterin-4a-carbinolamine dehydratase